MILGDVHGPFETFWLSCSSTSANDEFCVFCEPERASFLRFVAGSAAFSALTLSRIRVSNWARRVDRADYLPRSSVDLWRGHDRKYEMSRKQRIGLSRSGASARLFAVVEQLLDASEVACE